MVESPIPLACAALMCACTVSDTYCCDVLVQCLECVCAMRMMRTECAAVGYVCSV